MSNIQAGDVMVCVDDSPCRNTPFPGAPFGIKYRQTLRVIEVDCYKGKPFLVFEEPLSDAFAADRFRKVQKAGDKDFIAQIKACRPKRDRVSS